MKKIFEDTLKKDGKWDKQALTFFASFVLSVALGISNTIASYVLKMTENQTADNVFNSFMILTGTLSGMNIGNKLADVYKNSKSKKEELKNEEE